MAELTTPDADETVSGCCATAVEETCCEPGEKSACCDTRAAGDTCGCAAGQATPVSADDLREIVRQLCEKLVGTRREDYEASRQRLGITREAAWHQETPAGTVSVICLEADDPGSAMHRNGHVERSV